MPKTIHKQSKGRKVLVVLGGFDQQLHRGIRRYAQEAGWILDVSPVHYGVLPRHWDGDGIISLIYPSQEKKIRELLSRTGAKLVNLSNDVDIGDGKVVLNNMAIGKMVAEHFLEQGLKNFAFINFSNLNDTLNRRKGFCDRLAADGFKPVLLDYEKGRSNQLDWFQWLCAKLKEQKFPIGIIAQNDNRAVGVLDACETIGLHVPEQVSVVGVDNKHMICLMAPVPLSSVESNRDILSFEGAALLDRLMNGEPAPEQPIIIEPSEVVQRQSSNIMSIKNTQVARALQMINENFQKDLTAEQVLENSHSSRCSLYRDFKKYVGRSISEEITHKRTEHAKRLLIETDEKLYEIAIEAGFRSGEHFSRTFRKVTGSTPTDFRRDNRDA